MNHLKSIASSAAITILAMAAFPAMSATVKVTNGADSGSGSFRSAIMAANADASIKKIKFGRNIGQIDLLGTVIYDGPQALTIDGAGATIDGGGGAFDLLVDEGGGDLTLKNLTVQNGGANGIVVDVPAAATGEISVSLFEVTIRDHAEFGLLVDDLTNGSAASVGLSVAFSSVTGNGLSASDLDGIRVDEGGEGDIVARVSHSEITDNGADGLELDESGDGDAVLTVLHSTLDRNGALFLETDDPDDADDGLDVDEADDGDVRVRLTHVTLNDNTDDGLGIDEGGDGNVELTTVHVEASETGDKGLSIDETGNGNLEANLIALTAQGNVEDGANLEEADDGDFDVRVTNSTFTDNVEAGIQAEQGGAGSGVLWLVNVFFADNLGGDVDDAGVTAIPMP